MQYNKKGAIMRRRILTLMAVAGLAVGFGVGIGCGGDDSTETVTVKNPPAQTDPAPTPVEPAEPAVPTVDPAPPSNLTPAQKAYLDPIIDKLLIEMRSKGITPADLRAELDVLGYEQSFQAFKSGSGELNLPYGLDERDVFNRIVERIGWKPPTG